MKITRVVKQVRNCIQYTGDNIDEVFDFINEHGGNANDVTLEELKTLCKRPDEYPLDQDCEDTRENFQISWRPGEEYHFYLMNNEDDFCRLIGICKGDWFVEPLTGLSVVNCSDDCFNSFVFYGKWSLEK